MWDWTIFLLALRAATLNGCLQCHNRSASSIDHAYTDIDAYRSEYVKRNILDKLGLRQRPNMTSLLPKRLVDETVRRIIRSDQNIFANMNNYNNNPSPRNTELIIFAEIGPTIRQYPMIDFSPPLDSLKDFQFHSVILWLQVSFRNPFIKLFKQLLHQHRVTIYIFLIQAQNVSSALDSEKQFLLGTLTLSLEDLGWKKIDVTKEADRWLNEKTVRLLVDCVGCGNLIQIIPRQPISDRVLSFPFLVVSSRATRSKRNRRASDCGRRIFQCCRQRLYVSFKQLGWDDWIVAPSGYHANYCAGDCDAPFKFPDILAHYHSQVIDEFKQHSPSPKLIQCCAPTKLSSMSLIYYDQNYNIIKRDLPNMVVDECGCA